MAFSPAEAEFTAQLSDTFHRMDTDGSGYLEEGERANTNVRVMTRRLDREASQPKTETRNDQT